MGENLHSNAQPNHDMVGIAKSTKLLSKNNSQMTENKPLSPWNYKPWWCQPWSILLTGVTIISGSWLIFKTIWLTVLISLPILIWMGFFLLIWPQLIMRNGILDSYQNNNLEK